LPSSRDVRRDSTVDQGQTVAAQLDEWFAGDDYLRAAQAQQVREQLDELAGRAFLASGELALRQLSPESQEAFARLQELTAEHGTDQARRVANERYVERESERAANRLHSATTTPRCEQALDGRARG
jgi:hypothetical protein